MEAVSSVILCGGYSRRMGRDKANLLWDQDTPLVDLLARRLEVLGTVYLSCRDENQLPGKDWAVIPDRVADAGPMAGICAALEVCDTPLLFVTGCDFPFVTAELVMAMCSRIGSHDVLLPQDAVGLLQPLCGVYRKTALPVLEAHLAAGKYKLMKAVASVNVATIPASELPGGAEGICNVNTPQQWVAAKEQQRRMWVHNEKR